MHSTLSDQGISQWPIGTTKEVIADGYDPKKVASCCEGSMGGTRGCPVWESCIFARRQNGGFKGQGPKYVGVLVYPDEGPPNELIMPCFSAVMTLRTRMLAGNRERDEGRKGEVIRVIKQEGEEIEQTLHEVKFNPADKHGQGISTPVTKKIKVPSWREELKKLHSGHGVRVIDKANAILALEEGEVMTIEDIEAENESLLPVDDVMEMGAMAEPVLGEKKRGKS